MTALGARPVKRTHFRSLLLLMQLTELRRRGVHVKLLRKQPKLVLLE